MPKRHNLCKDYHHNLSAESTNSETIAKWQHLSLYLCKVSSYYYHISHWSYDIVMAS